MKKIFIAIIALVLISSSTFAQAPQKMSYQAVIRDVSDQLILNQTVGMQISILQGSSTGTAVYEETHTTTTNANGLVSLEIGNGTVVSGNFSTIDWGNGTYYIKTETDPTGGTTYTITGSTQLMSVPYAIHATTADSVTGTISESDPIYTAWDKSTGIIITESQISDLTHIVDTDTQLDSIAISNLGFVAGSSRTTYSVGDYALGGVVIWVDATGYHGLICAKEDQSQSVRWSGGTNFETMSRGDGIYAGEMNTAIIISAQGVADGGDYAALLCAEYTNTVGGVNYGDWYLPSLEELDIIYQNRAIIEVTSLANSGGGFSSAADQYYWSSTEVSSNSPWLQDFQNSGAQYQFIAKHAYYMCRAVRKF